ncbi:hypothetical protein Poly41_01310 [Novipirellula artificiosorum]|uniref:Uncharacterized protein n=1 Tax=Novipirellula artificiosorum TaxID=2528016 RepID=A0A5C6E3Q9_9BACT|nr:hypothetical protein Poly41_01310 [Novipirellula artificiosorum]
MQIAKRSFQHERNRLLSSCDRVRMQAPVPSARLKKEESGAGVSRLANHRHSPLRPSAAVLPMRSLRRVSTTDLVLLLALAFRSSWGFAADPPNVLFQSRE